MPFGISCMYFWQSSAAFDTSKSKHAVQITLWVLRVFACWLHIASQWRMPFHFVRVCLIQVSSCVGIDTYPGSRRGIGVTVGRDFCLRVRESTLTIVSFTHCVSWNEIDPLTMDPMSTQNLIPKFSPTFFLVQHYCLQMEFLNLLIQLLYL